jgi:predicted Zn-dependent protease
LNQTVLSDRTLREKYTGFFSEYDVSLNESMIGFNIAAEIASRGIVDNPPLHKYLNLLGTLILQPSNAYDRFFKIYVLDSSKPEAFSTPGGIIFVSIGLIKVCTSEAELGVVIAHEMTHAILHHGYKEIKERSNKIRAEEIFSELEGAAGNKSDSTEIALEEYMQEAYDSVVKPRLLTYEEEADRGAIIFLAQAGYDPNAVVSIIKRIPTLVPPQENDLEENPFMKLDYEKRSQSAAFFLNEYFPHPQGALNIGRFEKYCRAK